MKRRALITALLLVLLVLVAVWLPGCKGAQSAGSIESTSSTAAATTKSGNIEGTVGEDVAVGDAIVTVRALQSTFQPATPAQRLSESTPVAPGAGESFYQAYVRVKNTVVPPLRVDPQDFSCAIGGTVVSVEPTRSGPYARSLLETTSIDLLLTFKGPAGYQPVLMYRPVWYNGVVSIRTKAEVEESTTTTT